MLEWLVSLYTSVYWTKRVLIVLALVVFVCGGIRVFQVVSTALTKTDTTSTGPKPEKGFGKIDRISFRPIETNSYLPTEFRITTTKGNLDADNLYPSEIESSPLANVYRIIEQPIDLGTTEEPIAIGKRLAFVQLPQEVSSTVRRWNESNRNLEIDGQYSLINYTNSNLKTSRTSTAGIFSVADQNQLESMFNTVFSQLGITTKYTGYFFTGEYLNFDTATNRFVPSTSSTGAYFRVSAKRLYPYLVKTVDKASARAAYPSFSVTNNYFILPNLATYKTANDFIASRDIVEMKVYNWPINLDISGQNPNSQTYSIKNPRGAYNDLVAGKGHLVSLTESISRKDIDISEIANTKLVDVLSVRVDMYEDTDYTRFIQPVYIFNCELNQDGKKYQLIYYVSALTEDNFN